MNICCSICAELFRNSDSNSIVVTRCGHVFHNVCLSKWLQQKTTCPECRSKTTNSTIIRVYVNSSTDNSMIESTGGTEDLANLQNENDNLKFKLLEKSGELKSKEEIIKILNEEKSKLKTNQTQSRNVILALEQKIEQNKIILKASTDQIKQLQSQLSQIDTLKESVKNAHQQIRVMDVMKQLLCGTQQEAEALLREGRTVNELTTMVTALRRELRITDTKRHQLRTSNEELTKQLRICKEEKMKLEERCSIMESKLFQIENNIDDVEMENLPTKESVCKQPILETLRNPYEHLLQPRKIITTKHEHVKSPYLNIKSSSVAGFSPLLKRPASGLIGVDTNKKLSILANPRLIQHSNPTIKSQHRPSKLTVQNSVPECAAGSSAGNQFVGSSLLVDLTSRTSNLSKKFRVAPLSKPK